MTRLNKLFIFLGLTAVFGLGFSAWHNASPSLGSGSLYIPAYIDYQDSVSATTTLASFSGVLHTIVFTKPVAGSVINVYDSATTTTPTVLLASMAVTSTGNPFTLTFDVNTVNGLTVVQTGATSTMTLTYQQQ